VPTHGYLTTPTQLVKSVTYEQTSTRTADTAVCGDPNSFMFRAAQGSSNSSSGTGAAAERPTIHVRFEQIFCMDRIKTHQLSAHRKAALGDAPLVSAHTSSTQIAAGRHGRVSLVAVQEETVRDVQCSGFVG